MKTIMSLAILAAVSFGTVREVSAQGVVVEIAPPAAYIASSTPEYYEGRPVYYYNNSWYYRDHGRWLYYRREPSFLYERRSHWAVRPGYRHGDWGGRYHYRYHR